MDDHQGALSLLNVLAVGATLLTILFARQSNDIVLNLKRSAECIRELNELLSCLLVLLSEL
jgi:hypothetical protein